MRTRNYKIEITVNGKNYIGDGIGCNMGVAVHRALSRWRGYKHRPGPGFGTKPKEMIIKITRP